MNEKNSFFENLYQVEKKGYVDLDELAKLEGIELIYSEHNRYKYEFAGLIKRIDGKYIIIINGDHPKNRQRFTLAHEIAHYFLHKDEIEEAAIVDDGLYRSGVADKIERAANIFAAEILMPNNLIDFHMNNFQGSNTEEMLVYVAKKLRVSQQALAIKMGIPFDN
ncbi:MAG: ImmA/IrrE family metallo-endopeptidase [Alphaproteobacteria bacterium]|nr:ImmA/IrrE family metallo-endopeptidase [Alphaproteobacteria bacterium]